MPTLAQALVSIGAVTLACSAFAQQGDAPQVPVATYVAEPATVAPSVIQQIVERVITTHPEINARYHDFVSTLEDQNIARGAWRPR